MLEKAQPKNLIYPFCLPAQKGFELILHLATPDREFLFAEGIPLGPSLRFAPYSGQSFLRWAYCRDRRSRPLHGPPSSDGMPMTAAISPGGGCKGILHFQCFHRRMIMSLTRSTGSHPRRNTRIAGQPTVHQGGPGLLGVVPVAIIVFLPRTAISPVSPVGNLGSHRQRS
ncbi:MAG: hypothetical protein CM15mP74_00050 [Halieaceae bacterium]|nr:MAG: hypothetical protein CM15mP74_00050 [Halieaceae bacterium]